MDGYDRETQKRRFAELLEAAQDDLLDTLKQRERLDHKIRILQEDIAHLAPLAGVEVEDPIIALGLTDAIRYVFGKAKPHPMGPPEVKDALTKSGYDVSEYSNIAASIHTIIKRLLKKNEITPALPKWADNKDRKYVWCGGLPPPPPLPRHISSRMESDKKLDDIAEQMRKKVEADLKRMRREN